MATPAIKFALVQPKEYPERMYTIKGRDIPLTDLPWWAQWMLLFVARHCAWAFSGYDGKTYYCTHDQAIATSLAEAIVLANRPGWSYKELPVNKALPEEPVTFGIQAYPASNRPLQVLNAPRADEVIKRVDLMSAREMATKINRGLKAAVL